MCLPPEKIRIEKVEESEYCIIASSMKTGTEFQYTHMKERYHVHCRTNQAKATQSFRFSLKPKVTKYSEDSRDMGW